MRKKMFLILIVVINFLIVIEKSGFCDTGEVQYLGQVCLRLTNHDYFSHVEFLQIVVGVTSFNANYYALNGYIVKAVTRPVSAETLQVEKTSNSFKSGAIHLAGTPLTGTAVVVNNDIQISLQGGSRICGDNEGYCQPYIGYNIFNINLTKTPKLRDIEYKGVCEYVYWYDFLATFSYGVDVDRHYWQQSYSFPLTAEIVPCSSFQ